MAAPEQDLPSHLQMALASVRIFADDGALDLSELDQLVALALRDGAMDDDERHVLGNVFRQIERDALAPELRARIDEVRARFGL